MKKNIVVIFGGKTSEHDISIITAQQVLKALDKNKYNIMPIYISKSGEWFSGKALFDLATFNNFNKKNKWLFEVSLLAGNNFLFKKALNKNFKKLCKLDCAILAMHGVNGEDGSLQGLLELCNIPYTSSGVTSCGLCMDKVLMKRVFENLNLHVLPWFYVLREEVEKDIEKTHKKIVSSFNYPVIIKPANLGSSIGISVCNNKTELLEGLLVASEYDDKIIIEKCVLGLKEVNCSVLGFRENCKISSLEEPVSYTKFLSFEDKYLNNKNDSNKGGMANLKRILPAKITKEQEKKIKHMSLTAFKELDCAGVVRIDFIIDKDTNNVYINEVNTIPGSFAFYLWEFDKLDFDKLLNELIELAEQKYDERQKNKYSFLSKVVLNFSGGTKGIKNK
jgi:D-alanine-D-alanine ligase